MLHVLSNSLLAKEIVGIQVSITHLRAIGSRVAALRVASQAGPAQLAPRGEPQLALRHDDDKQKQ